jgi:hypothetical protein
MRIERFGYSIPSLFLSRARIGLVVLATALTVNHAQAIFHLWNIREVYTDANGSRQFIELFTGAGSQNSVLNQQIRVTDGMTTHTFTLTNNLSGSTANKALLIGTASITNFGSPKPNFIMPDNFLFAGGGTITFFGANSGAYTALPTDGIMSRTWAAGNAVNSPQNYEGQTGSITNQAAQPHPPSITITNPLDNALFTALTSIPVEVSATDSDGTVANVVLLINDIATSTNTVAPFGFTVPGLPAGNYALRARAEDNALLTMTSAPVAIRVTDRPMLLALPGISGPLSFQYNTSIGISYIVERASPLNTFAPVRTNLGTGGILQFDETDGSETQRTYRLQLK